MYNITKKLLFTAVLAGIISFNFSCKKGDQANEKTTLSQKEFALQLGKSLYQNFKQGSAKTVTATKGNLSYAERTVPPACGATTDSIINSYISANGLTQTVKGFLKLTYLCGGNNVFNGYALKDSIHTVKETAAAREEMTVKEDYVAMGSFGVVTINGKQTSHVQYNSKTGDQKVIDQYNDFTLKDLYYTPTGIQSAQIPYKANGTYNGTEFNFEGYIQFYFDIKFAVSVNGQVYWLYPADWSITEKI
ncbi:hypothetical protein [Mucilaginibacter terrae]|uniref:Uncharacterized protein n=1 Tax=Mucilaginibacter terrae TaxID=1955052 RepID=A0ABU3GYK5_9SPHI|nr:hypothetical protein [Mucilaginibacter terrae]MDT3404848.1 hypothetical protein [Mucilaginibacter terrae]